jgi:7-alpha-hydroxysteroid dehydrogenase
MTGQLEGRVAIVTGASRGLGRSIALAFAAHGAAVAVVARTEQVWDERLPGTIGETVAEIESAGGRAVAIRADLLDRDDLRRLVDEARAALGPITILINNAAFTAPGRPPKSGAPPAVKPRTPNAAKVDWPGFVGTPLSAFQRHFEIAVFAGYELMQVVAPDMIAAGHGAIVNITSVASRLPGGGPYPDTTGGVLPGYGGSKAALEHLTSCAAYDLQSHNISVNALSPSQALITPGLSYYVKEFDDNVGSPEEFAEAAVRLALVDPSVVTGRTIGHLDVLNGSLRPFESTSSGQEVRGAVGQVDKGLR